jgi:DNA polymerase-3 subunit epsilon
MREIVLDTETTGFEPSEGHRLVEIGCVELVNHMPTGREFHCYLNPERDMPAEAEAVHGLSIKFLQDKPLFASEVDGFLEFIGDAPLVIHNAAFDLKFLNAELNWVNRPPLSSDRAIDTLLIARKRFPGAPASLDALCRRFGIDTSARDKHGAIIDCQLLAAVYLELRGGRQPGLTLGSGRSTSTTLQPTTLVVERPFREPRPHAATLDEKAAHTAFLEKRIKNPLWTASS